jgi:hypothetical protein
VTAFEVLTAFSLKTETDVYRDGVTALTLGAVGSRPHQQGLIALDRDVIVSRIASRTGTGPRPISAAACALYLEGSHTK